MKYEVKFVTRGGESVIKFHCPGCGVWGVIDNDQYMGRVSIWCDCEFHETINLSKHGKVVHPPGRKIN